MKPVWARAAPVFLLGLAFGAVVGSWGQRAVFRHRMRGDPNHRRMMLDKLSRELTLDNKQKAAVSAVMDSKRADIDRLKAETFAHLEGIRSSADAEMAKILTPAQTARLESMHRARPMRINWEAPGAGPAP